MNMQHKAFPAYLARVGPFLRVGSHVNFQISITGESFTADGAGNFLGLLFARVLPHMTTQFSLTGIRLFAECTLEWPLPCVDSDMDHQIAILIEPLVTVRALEWPLVRVDPGVSL